MAVSVKIFNFWSPTPCYVARINQRFGGTDCLHLPHSS